MKKTFHKKSTAKHHAHKHGGSVYKVKHGYRISHGKRHKR